MVVESQRIIRRQVFWKFSHEWIWILNLMISKQFLPTRFSDPIYFDNSLDFETLDYIVSSKSV